MGNAVSVAVPSPELVTAAGAALPAVCTLAVAARLYNNRNIDGWLSLAALAFLWGQGICLIYGVATQALAAADPIPPPDVDPDTWVSPQAIISSQLFWAMLLIQIPCLTLIKLSFVIFYRRIFTSRTRRTWLHWYLDILAAILVAWCIAFFFSELFICKTDFVAIWDEDDDAQAADCIAFTPWDDALSATDFITDLFIFLTPIRLVFGLKLTRGQKWGAAGVFSLGGFAIAASITRFVIFTDEQDLTFTPCLYWTAVESGVALIACCLPTSFGIYTKLRRSLREKRERYRLYGSDWTGSSGGRTAVGSKNSKGRLGSDASDGPHKVGHGAIKIESSYAVGLEEMSLERSHST